MRRGSDGGRRWYGWNGPRRATAGCAGCGQEIGATLGVTPDVARERGRRIGAPAPGFIPRAAVEDPFRAPLPAGHPRSWGLLTAGTMLAGTGWPGWE